MPDIPIIQESSYVKITNEDIAHQFLLYQLYPSLWIHSTMPKSQTSLLYGNIEAVHKRSPELWPSSLILCHNNALSRKALSVKQFLAQKSITHPIPLIWLQVTSGSFQKWSLH
jgi:hypothetical protein